MKTLYVVFVHSTGSFNGKCGPRIFARLIDATAFIDIIRDFDCEAIIYPVKQTSENTWSI